MCWDIAVLLLACGCSGTGRLARRGSWAAPARGRVCPTVTWSAGSIGHIACAVVAGPQRCGPAVQLARKWSRSAAVCLTSPESFIHHFAAEALLL